MLKQLTALLGKKTKADDLEQIGAALAEVESEIAIAGLALEEAEENHDRVIVEAVAAGDQATLSELRAQVDEARNRVDLLKATRAALIRRREAAQGARDARRLAEQWRLARTAADDRRNALMRLDKALTEASMAIVEANRATARMADLLPVRPNGLPDSFPAHELAILVSAKLSAETEGAVRSSLPFSPHDLRQMPGILARHDSGAAQLFAAAPAVVAEGACE